MNVQIKQIKGDIIELLFNPKEEDLRVGDNLSIVEKEGRGGLIVQVIEFRTVTYPALVTELLELAVEGVQTLPASLFQFYGRDLPEMGNLKIAIAKVRKLVQIANGNEPSAIGHQLSARWDQWDGWIPTRAVIVERTKDKEVFANCLSDYGHRLRLGQTLAGEDFFIEGQELEKVNIITGVKGSGKSHLAKVILLQLIRQGAPAIVFDINREYIHLPPHQFNPLTGRVERRGIIHLEAGENFRLSVPQFGLAPLMTLLSKYGLPEVSAMHFENRLTRLLEEIHTWRNRGRKLPFLGLEQLIQMAEEEEFAPGHGMASVINSAIRSRLEALRNTRIFARHPEEAVSLHEYYEQVREGGALILDISALGSLTRSGLVQAIIEMIREICEQEIASGTDRFPFIFFEEAHLYVPQASIDYIVTRARHLGITSFFVTNMIAGLDEAVLRQADNLFLLNLPFEDDVRHVARCAITDYETMSAFVRRLRSFHALVIGKATGGYPLILRVDELAGINTAGETKFFFKRGEERAEQMALPLTAYG